MADTVTYNGITINTPLVDVIEAEAIYDDAGVSVVYTKYKIRVRGTITPDSNAWDVNFDTATRKLLVPRQQLVVNLAGADLFNLTADDATGPRPKRAEITEVLSGQFGIVVWEVEFSVQEKCEGSPNIISHTYSVQHQIDSAFYTVRTLHGKIIIATGTTPNNPDLLRGLVTPGVPLGFKRESMSFLVSPDGLQLEYEIIDREVYRTAPLPATDANGKFSVQMDNLVWYNHFYIELKGTKDQSKLSLFNAAFIVASSRIDFSTEFVKQAIIEEDLYENSIRFQVTSMANAQPAADGGANAGIFPAGTKIFTDIPNSTGIQKYLGPYGTALIAAAKIAFFDPCGSATIAMAQAPASNTNPGSTAGSATGAGQSVDGVGSSKLSAEQVDNPYVAFHQTMSFWTNNGVMVAPSCMAGVGGVALQMHNPYMIMTQEGTAIRDGATVTVPRPLMLDPSGVLIEKTIIPAAPEILPDKVSLRYAAAWRYKIAIPYQSLSLFDRNGFTDSSTEQYFAPSNDSTIEIPPQSLFTVETPIIPDQISIPD